MKFRTEINLSCAPKILSPERMVLLMGSCFSDNIGGKISSCGWPSIVNPCGVLYNPVSIAVMFRLCLLHRAIRREIVASSLTLREGRYVSWFMGSKIIDESPEECVNKVCEAVDSLEEGMEKADAIILTFGTPDVWILKGTDRAVGNCHKHPASEFEKKRISIEDIVYTWKTLIQAIRNRNPEVKIILTVSPRRYLSDGFEDNMRQKAVLILACEKLCKEIEEIYYFPAYEILNDDLRDYRFYKPDLLHPSEMAIDYVWDKLKEAYLDKKAIETILKMERKERQKLHKHIAK